MSSLPSIASKYPNLVSDRFNDWDSELFGPKSEWVIIPDQSIQTILPYVPNNELAKRFSNAGAQNLFAFEVQDASDEILSQLVIKDLANFSEACKFCYLIAKGDRIWQEKFHQIFPKVIPLGICPFTVDQQFKILFKRYIDELRPFNIQFVKNNETLVRLLGSNGSDGELNQLITEYQNLGGDEAVDLYLQKGVYMDVGTDRQKALSEQGKEALNKLHLFGAQRRLCVRLAGENYKGTLATIDPSSKQGKILQIIHFEIPKIFNNKKKFNEVIHTSAIIKNEAPRNHLELQWMKGNPLILADFGVFTPQEYSEKLECTHVVLEKVGICSTADLKVLGLLNEPALEKFKFDDNLSGDLTIKNQQLFERKEACAIFLEGLSKQIQNKIKESESHGVVLFKDNNNTWVEFQEEFERVRLSILEKCESPANLSNNFSEIVQSINNLTEAVNQENQKYQLIKLRAYIHQVDIRPTWGILNGEGIETLTEFVAQNPDANLFRMGVKE
jgi:hypothetical protein